MTRSAVLVAVALVVAAVAAPAAAGVERGVVASKQAETVAGEHVRFEVTESAVVDFTVDGTTLFERVAIDLGSSTDATGEVTGDGFSPSSLTLGSGIGNGRALINPEGGDPRPALQSLAVHDTERGSTFFVGGNGDRLRFTVAADATVRTAGENRAVVVDGDGEAVAAIFPFAALGPSDAAVTVDGRNVTVRIESGGVYIRQYEGARTADDRRQERLLRNGSLDAVVYADRTAAGSVRTVPIGLEQTVRGEAGDGRIDLRTTDDGTNDRLLVSVSEAALAGAANATVVANGEPARPAANYSAVTTDRPRALVRPSGSEPGVVDVLVGWQGIGELSIRAPQGADGADDTADDGGDGTTDDGDGTTDGFDGRNVAFRTADGAVRNYTVDGRTVVSDLRVQAASEARASAGLGAGAELGADTVFAGAGLSVAANASASTTLRAESGAEIRAHDNDRGIVVVRPGGEPHVARFGGGDGATAERESAKRAVVRRNGSSAAVIVVGEGNVSVAGGNVTARTDGDGRVVYRQYDGERSDSEREQERLIANGTAAAEVYLQAAGSGAERTVDVVRYGRNTTVEVTEESATRLTATVNRTERQGKLVLFSLQESVFENAGNATVTVDGEAAVRADSYAGVRSAIGGDRPAFLVRSATSAEATVDVVVGINHFSARQVSIASGDGTPTSTPTPTPTDGTDEDTASDGGDTPSTTGGGGDGGDSGDGGGGADTTGSGGQPGFGALTAVLALAGAALLARRRL